MNKSLIALLSLAALCGLPTLTQAAAESPAAADARMAWWREAKFGMFIHWGLYAIPAGGEWHMGNNKVPMAEYQKFAGQFKAVIDKTLALFPASKIILLDILPTARKTQTVVAANELIAKLSDEKTVFRLNLGEQMVKEGDTSKGFGKDRLHLTEEGYLIWAETMEPLLSRASLAKQNRETKIRAS